MTKHRLRIIDNMTKDQWDYTCSCGVLIGWIAQPATHPRIRQAAHQFVRSWEDHTTGQWLKQRGPDPGNVTIWIEPIQQWLNIDWVNYESRYLVLLKPLDYSNFRRLPDPDPNTTAFELTTHKYLSLSPTPGNPLIWTAP